MQSLTEKCNAASLEVALFYFAVFENGQPISAPTFFFFCLFKISGDHTGSPLLGGILLSASANLPRDCVIIAPQVQTLALPLLSGEVAPEG